MSNVIDLNQEREINELIDKLGSLMSDDQTMTDRTVSVFNGSLEMRSDGNALLSVRVPKELMEWIDSYSRIAAVNSESRITRTDTVVGFLETMKALMEYQSKTQWGGKSHQQMIKELLESGQNREETQHHEVTP